MRFSFATLVCLSLASMYPVAGCSEKKAVGPESGHVHQHIHGPHDGELIELGNEEYHGEMIHDDQAGAVTIYVLDKDHEKAVPISAPSITIKMMVNSTPIEFKLPAKPQEGDPTGKSSRFESNEQALGMALDNEQAERELIVPIGDKTYNAKFAHFDDEHHHHHEAPGADAAAK